MQQETCISIFNDKLFFFYGIFTTFASLI